MSNNEILLALSNMLDDGEDHEMMKQDISLLKELITEYIEIIK